MSDDDKLKTTVQIARRIYLARQDSDLSQGAVAHLMGTTQQTIGRWEDTNNATVVPTAKLAQLAEILERPVGWFFGEETVDERIHADATDMYIHSVTGKLKALERENTRLRGENARLLEADRAKAG